jgi:hypothetical protein
MSKNAKTWIVLFAVVLFLPVAYFLTLGSCFLPAPNPRRFVNEPLEMRIYPTFAIPLQSRDLEGAYERLKWNFTRPGQARLFATGQRLAQAHPNLDDPFQKCLEEFGYTFPKGCWAIGGGDPPFFRITHYPSMLNRIERDLHFKSFETVQIGTDGKPLPNPKIQRTGAGRSAAETNKDPWQLAPTAEVRVKPKNAP